MTRGVRQHGHRGGGACHRAASRALKALILAQAAAQAGMAEQDCVLEDGAVRAGNRRIALSDIAASAPIVAEGRATGSPRSVAFNVHGFKVAVNRGTGEVRILKSVQAGGCRDGC